jgi:predicted acylesterase/phospholipase RssA
MAPASGKTNGAGEPARIGLALAGGGPGGAVYEIGALRALEEALEGVDFTDLDLYVGVSAGAFISSCLANGIPVSDLCWAIVDDTKDNPFAPVRFLTPAFAEIARRAVSAPGFFLEGLRDLARDPRNYSLLEPVLRLSRSLPVGIFESRPIRDYLARILKGRGRTDDFRRLGKRLVVVAADLDSGQAVRFGEPGWDDVPISLAVQASSALPGFFAPVRIRGRHYVDGVLLKTMHASVALDAGCELVLAVNPIVPADTARAVEEGVMRSASLVDQGLPVVLSQTFRSLIRSRVAAGMKNYDTQYPGSDILFIEPRRDDYRMFFTNIFSFSERKAVCEHAYRRTRIKLLERAETLAPMLERHGVRLRTEILADPDRDLWSGLEAERRRRGERRTGSAVVHRLDRALTRLGDHLAALPPAS